MFGFKWFLAVLVFIYLGFMKVTEDYLAFMYVTVPLGDWLEKKESYSYNHKTTIWISHEYYLNPEFHKILSRVF